MFIINDRNQIFNGKTFVYVEKEENLADYNLQEVDEELLNKIISNTGCEITRYEDIDDVAIKRVEIVSYKEAIEDITRGNVLLCNNIKSIDEDICNETINYNCDEDGEYPDIFQYFLCDLTQCDLEYIKNMYPEIIIGYSKKLELHVLMVDHYGTSWCAVDTYRFIKY